MKKQASPGFSLIELLVVVALIGVLATLAVPLYQKMMMRARNSAAISDLGQLIRCETAFFDDRNQYGRTHATAAVAAQGAGDFLIGPGTRDSVIASPSNFMAVGVSQGVHLIVSTDAATGRNFTGMAKQIQGTRIYGVDSDVGTICQHSGVSYQSLVASGVALTVSTANDLSAAGGWQPL